MRTATVMSGQSPTSNLICQRSEPAACRLAPHHHDGRREFAVDGQKIGCGILFDGASRLFDPRDHVSDDVRVHTPKRPIDLDVAIVAIGREADQFVGAQQAAEAALIGAAGWQAARSHQ